MTDVDDGGGDEVRTTAQALVELTAAVLETDATSVWWYDDEAATCVARHPADRMPAVLSFAEMPEVGASILAGETRLYIRDELEGPVRDWMDGAGIAVSLRLPVEAPDAPRHFLGISWATTDHPPVESLLPTARRFAEHIARTVARGGASQVGIESVLELSDNVAQALVLARAALRLGRQADAEHAIDRAIAETQRIMGRVVGNQRHGMLRRTYPPRVLGDTNGAEQRQR